MGDFHFKKTVLAIILTMSAALLFNPVMTVMVPDFTFDAYAGEGTIVIIPDPPDPPDPVSVPDASVMWLLGPAIIFLGLLGRRKAKN